MSSCELLRAALRKKNLFVMMSNIEIPASKDGVVPFCCGKKGLTKILGDTDMPRLLSHM